MKNITLLLSLLCLYTSAHADWTKVEHAAKDPALYVDAETLKPSGHGTMVLWHLIDHAATQQFEGKNFRSMKGQDEYDCAKGASRELLHFWHTDPMGNSAMVHAAYVPTGWLAPAAGSTGDALLQIACKAK